MTKLELSIQTYQRRTQFHDATLLNEVIRATREEERSKFLELIAAAQRVMEAPRELTGKAVHCQEHSGYGFTSDCIECKARR